MKLSRIDQIEKEIAEIKNRLPEHSISSQMMQRLIELEDELVTLKNTAES